MSKNFTFNNAPSITMRRSRISGLSYGVNTSMSMGRLYPFYNEEILPGDTFKVNSKLVARLSSSFLKPIYGNIFCDVFYFFVPWRLVYDDFSCVFGENKEGYWANEKVYQVPHQYNQEVVSKSVSDYLELPLGTLNAPLNILYHRAVALCWNDWFRDENYQEPVLIHKGEWNAGETLNGNEWDVDNYTGMCPPINKFKDYFTSVLPDPQKGEPVGIGLGGLVPVITGAEHLNTDDGVTPLYLKDRLGSLFNFVSAPLNIATNIDDDSGTLRVDESNASSSTVPFGADLVPSNLYADLSSAPAVSVNDLRMAFQTQKILERDALGTRYVEHILNTFGVSNPDARLQRPELLNATRFQLNVQQVAATNAPATANAPKTLANLGAYSLTSGKSGFAKAFTEYGCVLGFVAIRQFHTYQQGMPKRFNRFKRFDYYNPALAYIGMTPVKSTEIYASAPNSDIFGYQRPWAEYRHHQNVVSGEMRSDAENSLDMWHLGDDYANQPVASDEFIREVPTYLDRTISVTSEAQDQFVFDIWHDVDAVRVMPANPMPGLIDHY